MVENEQKILLNKNEYDVLCEVFDIDSKDSIIENRYYDTYDLKKNAKNVTCRIRNKDEYCEATIKCHGIEYDSQNLEITKSIKNKYDDSIFRENDLIYHGSLTTFRRTVTFIDDIHIMIDKSVYFDVVDYEIEFEYSPGLEKSVETIISLIANILTVCGTIKDKKEFLSRLNSGNSKSERFFKRKKQDF